MAASSAAPAAALTWAEAQRLPTTYAHYGRQAGRWFAELRKMLTASGLSQYDITTCAKHGATWRGYLAFHPRARDIIGDGVHRLEVHSSGPQHVDLVVRRVDGTDVRLEGGSPEERPPTPPPLGCAALAVAQGHDWFPAGGVSSPAEIKQWLAQRLESWEASVSNPHPHTS